MTVAILFLRLHLSDHWKSALNGHNHDQLHWPAIISKEGVDDGREQVPLDDVPVVVLVLERDDLAHEPQRAQHQERVRGPHEDQDTPEQVLRGIGG